MNKKTIGYLIMALIVLAAVSACGNKTDGGGPNAGNAGTEAHATDQAGGDAEDAQQSGAPEDGAAADPAGQPDSADGSAGNAGTEAPAPDNASPDASEEILIIIDQTQKPIEGNSFDFVVNQIPEGYFLSEMAWNAGEHRIVNTTQEAIEHGGNGEDGFYISGDGQFMGFFYPDDMKGEEGEVVFTFANDQGNKLTWKKTITLK